MSKGGKAPKAGKSTQVIGEDPLSRALAGAFLGETGRGAASIDKGIRQNLASTDARGLTDPSVDLLRKTIAGNFVSPEALGGQIEAAAAPALREFRRSIAPSIAGRFAASGRTGSGAEASAFEDAQDIVSRNIAEVASGAIQQERDRQQQAAGIFPQVAAGERDAANSALQASQLPLNRLTQIAGALPSLRITKSKGGTPGGGGGKGGSLGSLAGGLAGSFLGPVGTAAGTALGGYAGGALFGGGQGAAA
ncbi:MAG: hypothetical protein R3F54_28700 [Alphaproteobacteria bacterium]